MARTLLVTVGVSLIAENVVEKQSLAIGFERLPAPVKTLDGLRSELKRLDSRAAGQGDRSFDPQELRWATIRTAICNVLSVVWSHQQIDERQRFLYSGAELASLKRLGHGTTFDPVASDDRVVLLASDTPSGEFCATIIRDALTLGTIGLPKLARPAIVERIPGLRPDTGERFLAEGLPGAARKLYDYSRQPEQTLLIGSGGYKGLLPYLGPLGMALKIPLLYLYEDSEDLLELRPLPMELKLQVIRDNSRAFTLLRPQDGSLERRTCPSEDFWSRVYPDDRVLLQDMQILEEPDERIRLSATGVLAWLLAWINHPTELEAPAEPLVGS